MTNEVGPTDKSSPGIRVVAQSELQALFASNSDIGHRVFIDIVLDGLTARQSIFPGSIFRGCKITNCDFSRSDFEGVRFEKCEIFKCSFEGGDFRSTLFSECRLIENNFNGVYFSDNTINGGSILTTTFDQATITKNQFISVHVESISNTQSTILHNDFLLCDLECVRFADCTALYSYFDACRIKSFEINADSLGLSFGLTADDLARANLVFLGRKESGPVDADLIDNLIKEYENRNWQLHAAIAVLNFGHIHPLNGWSQIFECLESQLAKRRIRLDDVSFVMHVAKRLADREALPFYSVIAAHDSLLDLSLEGDEETVESRALARLRNRLVSLLGEMQLKWVAGAADVGGMALNAAISMDLVFEEEPDNPPVDYIAHLIQRISRNEVPLQLVARGPGSWHEIIQTTVLTALAIYTVLYLVEGSLIKLLLIRARLELLTAPKVPKKFIEKANDPRQISASELIKIARSLISEIGNGTLQLPPKKSGLTKKSLREIAVKTLAE